MNFFKTHIHALVAEAAEAKELFKAGKLPEGAATYWTPQEHYACGRHSRKAKVTALLNLYHEVRGSEHRHGTCNLSPYSYAASVTQWRRELKEWQTKNKTDGYRIKERQDVS